MNIIIMLTMISGTVVGQAEYSSMDKCTIARNEVIVSQQELPKSVKNNPLYSNNMKVYCVIGKKKVAVKEDKGPERVFNLFEGFLDKIQKHEEKMKTKGCSATHRVL
ncbi:hypothetical protein N9V27_00965 [bacterium]|nr:hypothetical protein [bacterium]